MKLYTLIGAISVAAWSWGAAVAVPLVPGGVVFPTGVTFDDNAQDPVARPELGGTVRNDNIIGFRYDPTPLTPVTDVGGQLQNRVIENSDGNMVFMPRLRNLFNIDGGTFAILGYSLTGYAGWSVDADFRLDGLGDRGFSSVSRSDDGDRMTFRFDDPLVADSILPPGLREESYFGALVTDAEDYDLSGTMTIFGEILPLGGREASEIASNLFTIEVSGVVAPVDLTTTTVVPLPAGGLLLLSGFGMLAMYRRKARRGA